MIKKTIFSLFLALAFISKAPYTMAQDVFYSFVPANSELIINGEMKEFEEAQMIFYEANQVVQVPIKQQGIRLYRKNLEIELQEDSKFQVGDELSLQEGSIHVLALNKKEKKSMKVGNMQLTFSNSEFIAYVSGDGTEQIIKVLDRGDVEVRNTTNNQLATLKSLYATSADEAGRLVIPYKIESPAKTWWTSQLYQYKVEKLPISSAGEDQRVLGNIPVVLNGEGSEFITGDVFEWTLTKAPQDSYGKPIVEVAFDSTNIVKPLFTPTEDGEYRFTLMITNTDGKKSNTDEVIVYVGREFLKPIALFPDVPADHPNNLAITYLYKKNVMKGSKDPETGKITFRPDETVNRVEILKTVFENRGFEIPTVEEVSETVNQIFEDVKPSHWFAPYVLLGKKKGIVKGNDGIYRPADGVILVEALKIIVETNGISMDAFKNETDIPYPDAEENAWYNPYLFFVRQYNLFDVNEEGNIIPDKPLSRAELAEILYRMDSINLLEKRGYVSGKLKRSDNKQGIADADILIYKALQSLVGKGASPSKGELYLKTQTKSDGSFGVSLPIHTKFYIEAATNESISLNKIITEVEENKTMKVELEMKVGEKD